MSLMLAKAFSADVNGKKALSEQICEKRPKSVIERCASSLCRPISSEPLRSTSA